MIVARTISTNRRNAGSPRPISSASRAKPGDRTSRWATLDRSMRAGDGNFYFTIPTRYPGRNSPFILSGPLNRPLVGNRTPSRRRTFVRGDHVSRSTFAESSIIGRAVSNYSARPKRPPALLQAFAVSQARRRPIRRRRKSTASPLRKFFTALACYRRKQNLAAGNSLPPFDRAPWAGCDSGVCRQRRRIGGYFTIPGGFSVSDTGVTCYARQCWFDDATRDVDSSSRSAAYHSPFRVAGHHCLAPFSRDPECIERVVRSCWESSGGNQALCR